MLNATPPTMPINMSTELGRLGKTLDDLEGVLRQHQQVLRQKAMSLPQGFLPALQKLRTDLDVVGKVMDEAQTEVIRLRSLSDTAGLINSTLELDDVLNAVMDNVIRLTSAERGYLVLRNDETKELDFRVARNMDQQTLVEGEFIVSRSVVRDVAESGNPVVTMNAGQDPRFQAQESIVNFALRSILCVPLMVKGKVTGVIYADNRVRINVFGPKELSLLLAFANQAAVAIENARLYESVRASLAEITAINTLMDNVFASIASGVITTQPDDSVLILNDAACRILDIVREQTQNRSVWEILPYLNDEQLAQLAESVKQQEKEYAVEIEPEIRERGVVDLNLKFSPLRGTRQGPEGMAIVVDDLTETKRRDEQLSLVKLYLPPAMVDNITSIDKLGLGGERRLVTTMFIDVRGFNAFPPTLRPQEFMETLNVYLTIASDAVTQQNGVIDKYMANEIMGLFNTQLNPEDDHSWRAVNAALNMAEEYTEFYRLSGEPEGAQYFRVGIHTGIATLGNAGSPTRKEFTAIGDAINLAHRILENAKPGQIIISEDTFHYCEALCADPRNGLEVASLGEIRVKGREQGVNIYQISRHHQVVVSSAAQQP